MRAVWRAALRVDKRVAEMAVMTGVSTAAQKVEKKVGETAEKKVVKMVVESGDSRAERKVERKALQ